MDSSSKIILVGGILIISVGAVNAMVNKRPETPVFAGGIGVILLASLLEAIGTGPGRVAAALVGLASVTVLFAESPALFTALANAQKQQTTQGK